MIEIRLVSMGKYYIINKLICQLKVVLNNKKYPVRTFSYDQRDYLYYSITF